MKRKIAIIIQFVDDMWNVWLKVLFAPRNLRSQNRIELCCWSNAHVEDFERVCSKCRRPIFAVVSNNPLEWSHPTQPFPTESIHSYGSIWNLHTMTQLINKVLWAFVSLCPAAAEHLHSFYANLTSNDTGVIQAEHWNSHKYIYKWIYGHCYRIFEWVETKENKSLTFGMKHMKYETDFYRGTADVVSIQMQVRAVSFGIFQYPHCTEHAFVEWQNQLLWLIL